jgi:hypothetical protein
MWLLAAPAPQHWSLVMHTFPKIRVCIIDIIQHKVELNRKFSPFVKTFAFCNKKNAKIIETLMLSCERGKIKTWSHLFSQLVDVFEIIFATFHQILMQKAIVFAKIRKQKLLFKL